MGVGLFILETSKSAFLGVFGVIIRHEQYKDNMETQQNIAEE